jgi:hypothetical protein
MAPHRGGGVRTARTEKAPARGLSTPKEVSFFATKRERGLSEICAERARRMAHRAGWEYSMQDAEMDLLATHANGCPLDFEKLVGFDDFNFAHDVFGIRRHLERETGQLLHCFLPRCARPQRRGA